MIRHHSVIQLSDDSSVARAITAGLDPRRVILREIDIWRSITLFNLKRFPEAADSLRRALALAGGAGPRHQDRFRRAWILKVLAEVLEMSGQYPEAVRTYREALELVPNEAKIHEKLAEILANCPDPALRDPAQAVRIASRGVELSPEDRHILRVRGISCFRAGDWRAAVEAIERSMARAAGGEPLDWLFLAMARWRQGDRDEGRRWYDKAVAWLEDHPSTDRRVRNARGEAEALIGPAATPAVGADGRSRSGRREAPAGKIGPR